MSLLGNPALFRIRESGCPFHLMWQTQGLSNTYIGEGSLLLRCLWKVAIPLEAKAGISYHLEMIWGTRSFSRVTVLNLMFL